MQSCLNNITKFLKADYQNFKIVLGWYLFPRLNGPHAHTILVVLMIRTDGHNKFHNSWSISGYDIHICYYNKEKTNDKHTCRPLKVLCSLTIRTYSLPKLT